MRTAPGKLPKTLSSMVRYGTEHGHCKLKGIIHSVDAGGVGEP